MHLLDTNILTALHTGHPKIIAALENLDDPQVATTIVTKAELLRGRIEFLLKADQGVALLRAQARLSETEQLLKAIEIVPLNAAAIAHFDQLITQPCLRKAGRADLLIASIALAHRATLVTRNLKDFQRIPSLRLTNWFTG